MSMLEEHKSSGYSTNANNITAFLDQVKADDSEIQKGKMK